MRSVHFGLWLVWVAVISTTVSAQCTYTDPTSGAAYDLTALQTAGPFVSTEQSDQYIYTLAPCVSTQANCAQAAFNQMTSSGTCIHIVATWNGPQYGLASASDPTAGLTVTFGNGDACYMNKQSNPRTTTITFKCDCSSLGTAANLVVTPDPSNTCNWLATFPTSAGCPVDHCSGGKKSGLSGGSIFLVILVVVIPVYIVVGCVYKRHSSGAAGMDACPNIEFWRDFPSLVSDGFKFTIAKLSCRKGGSYDTMA